MSSYKSIKINVSQAKARKIANGNTVNLTAAEVAGEDEVLHVHPLNYDKLIKAKRAGKGTRFQLTEGEVMADIALGGNIFKSIWKGVKSLWNPVIKPALSLMADNLVPIASAYTGNPAIVSGVRKGLKQLTGVGLGGPVAKGSEAAKQKMATLRAMRKGGSMKAGSFKL